MKTFIIKGGLGNQIFAYAFSLYCKQKLGEDVRYIRRRRGKLRSIEDTELFTVFDMDIETAGFYDRLKYKFCKTFKIGSAISKENSLSFNSSFFEGFWQDKKYYQDFPKDWIEFRPFALIDKNKDVIKDMKNSNSVFIHVRRGNYLKGRNIDIYGNVCTKEYYERAVAEINARVENPRFFIFSNDIEWIEENFDIPNSQIISWNQGSDSYLDLYLMCQCKHAIIANSTFSYWGAMLVTEKDVVVYPQKWYNSELEAPDIAPSTWIGI